MIQIATLFPAESDSYYGLMQQLTTVKVRQALNSFVKPYQDVLKEIIPKLLQMKYITYENLRTLINGLMKLKNISSLTTSIIKATVISAAKQAFISGLVVGGMVDAAVLVYRTWKDWRNPDISRKVSQQRFVRNAGAAVGSTTGGAAGAATGAVVGTIIFPGVGTVIGTIIGSVLGGTVVGAVGGAVGHSVGKAIT